MLELQIFHYAAIYFLDEVKNYDLKKNTLKDLLNKIFDPDDYYFAEFVAQKLGYRSSEKMFNNAQVTPRDVLSVYNGNLKFENENFASDDSGLDALAFLNQDWEENIQWTGYRACSSLYGKGLNDHITERELKLFSEDIADGGLYKLPENN